MRVTATERACGSPERAADLTLDLGLAPEGSRDTRSVYTRPLERSSPPLVRETLLPISLWEAPKETRPSERVTPSRNPGAAQSGRSSGKPVDRKSTRLNSSHVKISYAD